MGNINPDTFPNSSYADWVLSLLRKNAETEEKVAQIFADDGTSWTYSELLEHSVRVAAGLPKLGINSGDMVSFVTRNSHELYAVALGCSYAGVIMAASVPDLTASGLRSNFRVVKPKFVVTRQEYRSAVEQAINAAVPPLEPKPKILDIKQMFKDATKMGAHADPATFKPVHVSDPKSHVFVCLFSSGTTTGKQKAVKLTDYGFIRTIHLCVRAYDGNPGPHLHTSQISWVSWWFTLSRGLLMGWTRIVVDEASIHKNLDTIHRYKPAILGGLGSMFLAMGLAMEENPGRWDASSIKRIVVGGDPIMKFSHERLAKLYKVPVHQEYGSTELGMVTVGDVHGPIVLGSVGKAVSRIKLVDPNTGEEIWEPNKPGEIVCEWAVMSGYVDEPEATAAVYDDHGWFRTGDIATCNEFGDVFIVDRFKEMFKHRGHQISPSEIEDIIMKMSGVKQVAVTSKKVDDIVGDVPIAFVVRSADSTISEKDIQEFVDKEIDHDSKRLRGGVVFTDAIPRNPTGKLSRPKLREMANKPASIDKITTNGHNKQ